MTALAKRGWLARPELWLKYLDAPRRGALFELSGLAWRDPTGALDQEIVGLLPEATRALEARRNLALPGLATQPVLRLSYAGCSSILRGGR